MSFGELSYGKKSSKKTFHDKEYSSEISYDTSFGEMSYDERSFSRIP